MPEFFCRIMTSGTNFGYEAVSLCWELDGTEHQIQAVGIGNNFGTDIDGPQTNGFIKLWSTLSNGAYTYHAQNIGGATLYENHDINKPFIAGATISTPYYNAINRKFYFVAW